jgi:hypothetical protein
MIAKRFEEMTERLFFHLLKLTYQIKLKNCNEFMTSYHSKYKGNHRTAEKTLETN